MSISQSSVRSTRFFADCQSASEGFLHKSCLTQETRGKRKKIHTFSQNEGLLTAIRGLVSCCLGNRGSTDLSFMGYDLGDVFEDESTVDTVSEETESLPSSRKAMVCPHIYTTSLCRPLGL